MNIGIFFIIASLLIWDQAFIFYYLLFIYHTGVLVNQQSTKILGLIEILEDFLNASDDIHV